MKAMNIRRGAAVKTAAVILIMLLLVALAGCGGKKAPEKSDYDGQLEGICSYISDAVEDYYKAGESGSDWTVILYKKAGRDFDYDGYLDDMGSYVSSRYQADGGLDPGKATEWHHAALAVLACGGDPTNIGEDKNGDPIDLIADGTYNWSVTDDLGSQGSNALIYALITLDSGNFEIPEGSRYTRESIIDELLTYQKSSGGFGLDVNGKESTDITAMALQALGPYYTSSPRIQEAVDMATAYMSDMQEDSGLYLSGDGYSSETISQMIMALCALGRDPAEDEMFIKSHRTLIDGLMEFRMDNGSFSHDIPEDTSSDIDNLMSSQQAGLAFAALKEMEQEKK